MDENENFKTNVKNKNKINSKKTKRLEKKKKKI